MQFNPEDYYTFDQLSEILHCKRYTVTTWAMKGMIKNITYYKKKAYIPRSSLLEIQQAVGFPIGVKNFNNYLTIKELKTELSRRGFNIPIDTINGWFGNQQRFKGYFKYLTLIFVHKKEIPKIINYLSDTLPQGYVSLNEFVSVLAPFSRNSILRLFNDGKIDGAKKVNLKAKEIWIAPKETLDLLKETYELRTNINGTRKFTYLRLRGYLNAVELARRWKVSTNTIYHRLEAGNFPNSMIDPLYGEQYIPMKDILYIENKHIESSPPYTREIAIKHLEGEIQNLEIPPFLKETTRLFIEYGRINITKSGGREERLRRIVTYEGLKPFKIIVSKLTKEIFQLSEAEVQNLLLDNCFTSNTSRRVFVNFYNYCCSMKDIMTNRHFFISNSKDSSENDGNLMPAEIYYQYYNHVQDIELHIPKAIKSKHYSNMWLYTIMHLTDAWRGSDYIYELPHIEVEEIGVNSFEWFINNTLSLEQCQKIINQVQIKVRHSRASKNNAILHFLVQPDLIHCMATSMILSELHRRKKQDRLLLQTFISSGVSKTTPNKTHLKFFDNSPELKDFKSMALTKATMSYLFYSTIEAENEDSIIALELAQHARSHKNINTTKIYVTVTNKDGSINRVSINLFKRGHFGWLYNYMIMMALGHVKTNQTFEERTKAIAMVRGEFSLTEIEEWAKFLVRVRTRRESVIYKLSKLPQLELTDLIYKIFSGKMPSRTEHGQCLIYPKCVHPLLNSCFSCENFIPKQLVLIEAASEFRRLFTSITESKYQTIIRRDSEFVKYILILFNQALETFDEEYVNSFINLDEVKRKLQEIADKLLLK